jgi:hypothetical protein
MPLIASADCRHPLLLINGANYLDAIQKHCFYFALRRRLKTAFLCVVSQPLQSVLSLISLGSGIQRSGNGNLPLTPRLFPALNDSLSELYAADLAYYQIFPSLMDQVFALARRLSKEEGVEVLIVDALDCIEVKLGVPTSQMERRLISSLFKSTAHIGEMTIAAGYNVPDDAFADLAADSVFHCEG